MNWKDLKEKILFSYLGSDWISIDVLGSSYSELLDYLNSPIEFVDNENDILMLEVEGTKLYFYDNDNHHFDFDPKKIENETKWNLFLEFFIELSSGLNKQVIFRPEDSDKDKNHYYLISIHPNKNIEYFENVVKNYTDSNVENK